MATKQLKYRYELTEAGLLKNFQDDDSLEAIQDSSNLQELYDFFQISQEDINWYNLQFALVEIAGGGYVRVYLAAGITLISEVYILHTYFGDDCTL